jgi:phage-related protein
MPTFTPPRNPTIPIDKTVNARANLAAFGDGYTQRGGDGLNNIEETYTINWNGLTITEADEIEDFFIARGGFESFDWTPPRESTASKWLVSEWSRGHRDSDHDYISAKFVKVFDL